MDKATFSKYFPLAFKDVVESPMLETGTQALLKDPRVADVLLVAIYEASAPAGEAEGES